MRFPHASSVALLIGLVGLASMSGCPIFAWVAAVTQPPQEQKAAYELKDKNDGGKVVVWVRAITEELEVRDVAVRDLLGRRITSQLDSESDIDMVSYGEITKLLWRRPATSQATPQQIGEKVGAKKVIFIDVREFALRDTPTSIILRGRMKATLSIVDVSTGTQDWPTGIEGRMITYEDETREPERIEQGHEISRKVIAAVADKIAKLFYSYTPEE